MSYYIRIITVIITILPVTCIASRLVPEQCSFGSYKSIDSPIDEPLNYFQMTFNEGIELTKNAKAYIMTDSEELAVASSFEVSNYDHDKGTEASLYIQFSGECLPKGDSYTLVVESGSICHRNDRNVTNDAIKYTFSVPSDLGEADFGYYENGCTIVKTDGFICKWSLESWTVGNPEWEVYREGNVVRKYPVHTSMDWEIGYGYLDFEKELFFEKGVKYRIRLPAESVRAAREDIVNKEVILDFVGGYSGKLDHPAYSKCSLNDGVPDTANGITFHYDKPVALIQGKPLVLAEEYQPENREWEALPELSDDGLTLTVNFGDVLLEKGKDYKIVIPEGTVVAAEGDITVNERQEIRFTGMMSGVDTARSNSIRVVGAYGTITVSNAPEDAIVQVFTPDGKVVSSEKAKTETLTIEGLSRGIYIVRTGGIVRSVLLK